MRMVFPTDSVRFLNGLGADVGALVDNLLDEVQSKPDVVRVPVDIVETSDSFHFHLDLPGVAIEDLDIQIESDQLTVHGKRERTPAGDQAKVLRRERGFGEFKRHFELPESVNQESVDAEIADGVLTIVLKKIEKPTARKVAIRRPGETVANARPE